MLGKSFNQKKENKARTPSRIRLTWINSAPTIHDIRLLLAEAEKNRGILCELPIKTDTATFLLSCQSDHLSREPSWTLYEGEGNQQLWNYLNDNLEMIENIVNMSVLQKGTATDLKIEGVSRAPQAEPFIQSAATPPREAAPVFSANAEDASAPATRHSGWPAAGSSGQPAAQPLPAAADPSASWNMTQRQTQSGFPEEQADARWTAGQVGQWPVVPSPFAAPPLAATGAGVPPPESISPGSSPWSGVAGVAPPESINPSPWGGVAPPSQAAGYPSIQSGAQNDNPWIHQAGAAQASANTFFDAARFVESLAARHNLTIAELAMDPALPAACVDAALKLQEMVLKGHFNEAVALQALKLAVLNNGILDDAIIASARQKAAADPEELARQASRLLQQAGLLTEADMLQAEKNAGQHDNSFLAALLASKKVDAVLLGAAQDCQPLLSEGRLRQDQAIIALHYCVRSRGKLKDALEDLSIDIV